MRNWTDEKELMRSLYHEDNVPPSVCSKSKYDDDESISNVSSEERARVCMRKLRNIYKNTVLLTTNLVLRLF